MNTCIICNSIFRTKNQLGIHIDEKHPEIGKVEYYKKYISKDPNCGICLLCKKPLRTDGTRFNFSSGFRRKIHRECSKPTLNNWIIIFGKEIGEKKWKEYCDKQAYSNTFEYKQEKYGWTKEQFDNYNNSRAVTLDNLIKKHGTDIGTKMFNDYCEKQKFTNTKEYFIEKFGKNKGIEEYNRINSQKSLTLDNFIRKYGSEIGLIKFNEYINKASSFYSKISYEFFNKLIKKLNKNQKYYFGENEFGLWNKYTNSYNKYDFVDLNKHKIIEFNGEHFHPHSIDDKNFKNPYIKITAKEAWEKDRIKEQIAKDNGFNILYIWENEVNINIENEINKCINFLKD